MIVSLGFGLVAAIGISQVMGRNNNAQAPVIPKRSVAVAAVDLEHNSLLTEENVKLEEWPLDIVPENTVGSMEQIQDMATRGALSKGMPISVKNIVHIKQLRTNTVPHGFTVYSIKVSADDTIYGLLQPGDKVNIIGHIRGKPAKTFLRGLRVWNINAEMTAKTTSREESGANGDAIVGILTNERQAELIMQVQKEGSIKLVLRGDEVDVDSEGNLDQEGLSGLGLNDQLPEEPTPTIQIQPTPSLAPAPGSVPPQVAQPKRVKTMRVWNKDGVETVTFRDGFAVNSDSLNRPATNRTNAASTASASSEPATETVSNSDDSAVPADNDDRSRGLEEDQY